MRSVKDTFILKKEVKKGINKKFVLLADNADKINSDLFGRDELLGRYKAGKEYKENWLAALGSLIFKYTKKEQFILSYVDSPLTKRKILLNFDDNMKLIDITMMIRNAIKSSAFLTEYIEDSVEESSVLLEFCERKILEDKALENARNTYSLIFKISLQSNSLQLFMNYKESIYTKEYAEQVGKYLGQIFNTILHDSSIKLKNILLDSEQNIMRQLKLIQDKDYRFEYEYNYSIPVMLEESIDMHSQRIAISDYMGSLTYKELQSLSNKMANLLLNRGVKKGDIVAIIGTRSRQTIISILGILKLGAIYVPIDQEIPSARINYILNDAQPKMIILNDDVTISDNIVNTISIKNLDFYSAKFSNVDINGESIAYLLYTSGTTGNSKGVMIKHSSVVNLSKWFGIKYHMDRNRNVLHMTNISFDVSVEETITTLLNYGSIYIIPQEDKLDKIKFENYIKKNQINIAQFVPFTLRELLLNTEKIEALRAVICGGDKLDNKLKNNILEKGYNLYNHYGPTEFTVDATACTCEIESNYLGKPIANTEVFILDENNKLLPLGIPGELCLSGAGISAGYYNKPQITNEKFVWNETLKKKIYKTGDLASIMPDGNIKFIGRIDHQVKINGLRIELEEIEHYLLKYDGMQEAIVVVSNNNFGNKILIVYYKSDLLISIEKLKWHLYKYLPQYMVPNYYKKILEWPLTPNKKIDKRLLSQWFCDAQSPKYIAPQNSNEKEIEKIWKRILKQNKISMDVEFVHAGGDSLRATILSNVMLEQFRLQIPLTEIFTCTIRRMAEFIKENRQKQQLIEDTNLILLKRGDDPQNNLFLIHSGNGEAEAFSDISDNISAEVNIWGIRADRLIDFSPKNQTLEEIAGNYAQKIIRIQREGKVSLMGWCIGGSIAFETALQLEASGREVGFFGMINSFAPDKKFWGEVPDFTISSEKEEITKYPRFDDFIKEYKNFQTIGELWTKLINFYKKINLTTDEMKKCVYDDMNRAIPNYNADNITALEIIYYINVLRTFDNVRALYVPKNKLKTQCYFFRATNEQAANLSLWNQYCEKKIHVLDVEGNNFTILQYPSVIQFAALLEKILLREEVCN